MSCSASAVERELFRVFAAALPGLGRAEWDAAWVALGPEGREAVSEGFAIRNRPLNRRLAYRLVVAALMALPVGPRRVVIESLKVVRSGVFKRPGRSVRLPRFTEGGTFALLQALSALQDAGRGAVIVSYDVDHPACLDALPRFVGLLDEAGIPAVFNFLVQGDYAFPADVYVELERSRHEVGLHGDSHDIDFGNRGYAVIVGRLKRCLECMPVAPKGFRSPALSVGPDLFWALDHVGFQYDSSIPVAHPFHRSCWFPFPYRVVETRLVEIPVLLQDNLFFSDNTFSDEHAYGVARGMIAECLAVGGVAMLNLHMCVERHHERFHSMLLEYLASPSVPVCLPREVVARWKGASGSVGCWGLHDGEKAP